MERRDRIPVVEIEGKSVVPENNLWQVKLGLPGVPCMRAFANLQGLVRCTNCSGIKAITKLRTIRIQ